MAMLSPSSHGNPDAAGRRPDTAPERPVWVPGGAARRRARTLVGLGTVAAGGVAALLPAATLPASSLVLTGAATLLYAALLRLSLGWLDQRPDRKALLRAASWAEVVLDAVATGALVHLTGGIDSPVVLLLPVHALSATSLPGSAGSAARIALAPVVAGCVAALERGGVITHVAVFEPSRSLDSVYITCVLLVLALISFVVSRVPASARARGRQSEGERDERLERGDFDSPISVDSATEADRDAVGGEKARFIQTATHEIQSPVAVTRTLLSVLAQGHVGPLPPPQRDLIDRALRRLGLLQTRVEDLIDLAWAQSDRRVEGERRATAVTPAVESACKRFEAIARERSLELTRRVVADRLVAQVDSVEMDLVLNHLLSNAVKYTRHGGVRVLIDRENDSARIVVADDGIGIPEDARPQVFREFFRAANARALEEHGTGLGLAIVKEIVQRAGGRVDLASRLGRGTTVTVRLPLVPGS